MKKETSESIPDGEKSKLPPRPAPAPLPLRLLREVPLRLLWNFVVGAGLGNLWAITRFEWRKKRGRVFPPFLFISVTQRCNLVCKGCWATGVVNPVDMTRERLREIVETGASKGCSFFGILGGEPLLLQWLPDFFAAHRSHYFQLFTNGHLLDDAVARQLRAAGNVSPLISIEGVGISYVMRRGYAASYRKALAALECCHRNGLVTGVATSVSATNFRDVVSSAFVDEMVGRGAHYLWFYIYRPSGPVPGFEEALNDEQVRELRRFLLAQRERCRSAAIIDAYWDHDGRALCPAATGISHHVNAVGEVEPCPPVQCSDCTLGDGGTAADIEHSPLLAAFHTEVPKLTRGCVLMDHPKELAELASRCHAHDSSGRGRFYAELADRPALGCHNHGGEPMPETTWAYRFAKKHWFFGFGAYG